VVTPLQVHLDLRLVPLAYQQEALVVQTLLAVHKQVVRVVEVSLQVVVEVL
jgi:hypothetical protein